ncbi:hypothetical protein ACFL6N_02435 [Thermodesulfobacteriota bacterium]
MGLTFDTPGKDNTKQILEILKESVARHEVQQIVVASTYGDTGLAVAHLFHNTDVSVVVVTHNTGFKEPGRIEMTPDTRHAIESLGARIHTGTMPFRSLGTAIKDKIAYSQQDLVAHTLRLFGQGIKVCVEIAMMAADAGLITPDDILSVAGTARGADTLALISPQSSNRFFDIKVREILAKPTHW